MIQVATLVIDDLEVGMEAAIERKVTSEDINNFAMLTGDFHPLHTNLQYSLESGFSNIIAHGLLISSLSSTLVGMKLPGKNALVLEQAFKYKKPVLPGESLLIVGIISKIDKRFSIINLKIKITNQDKLLVATGVYQIKIRKNGKN